MRRATLIESVRLDDAVGAKVLLASETFQETGSFKYRAAFHVASRVPQNLIVCASSGNFGQAMARACQQLGKQCIVVMPQNASASKANAILHYGGKIEPIDTAIVSRTARVQSLCRQFPDAYESSAYDDPLVIEGNASLGLELAELHGSIDCILAPIGGGGLTSGILVGLAKAAKPIPVWAVEPAIANDAAQSFREGRLVANPQEPQTIADGVRTLSLGRHNWPILHQGLAGVIEVAESQIKEAVRLLYHLANLKSEPTGALSLAGLLAQIHAFKSKRVCCVISGGNVDPKVFSALI
jgi:threonine dehydratase